MLQRTILWELVKIFALSLVGIMTILVMAGIVAEASQQGLKPTQVLAIIPLLVPSFLPYTIPATTLFATCVVYGRLAHDNEILAIKAAGINILHVMWPGVFLGLVMSVTTMGLYYHLIPYTQYLLRCHFLQDIEECLYDMLRLEHCIKRPGMNYVIWIRQLQGIRLQEAIFERLDPRTGRYDLIAKAREAELHVDMEHQKLLIHMYQGQACRGDGQERLCFTYRVWDAPLPPELGGDRKPRLRGLTWPQLLVYRGEVRAARDEMDARFQRQMDAEAGRQPSPVLVSLGFQRKAKRLEVYAVDTEMTMRLVMSLGCLGFVLVGCPVGVWFSRSDYLSAFITCFVPILLLYYPMLLCFSSQCRQGSPVGLLWVADAAMALIGLLLFRRLLKH